MEEAIERLKEICCPPVVYDERIEIRKGEDESAGWGLFVKNDGACQVASGTILMRIPFTMCISTSSVLSKTPIGKCIEQDIPDLLGYPDEILALGLMYARNCAFKRRHMDAQPSSSYSSPFVAIEKTNSADSQPPAPPEGPEGPDCFYHEVLVAHVKALPLTFNTTVY
jgi:hypothetical protein